MHFSNRYNKTFNVCLTALALLGVSALFAQEKLAYQEPPKEILELVDFERSPNVILDDGKEHMLLLYRDNYKSIEELSREEMRLAGLRIDPLTNIGSRVTYYNNIKVKYLRKDLSEATQAKGLPANPKLANFIWSPDQHKIAFTHTSSIGVEAWVLDLESAEMKRLTDADLNANLGNPIRWFRDGNSLLVKKLLPGRKALTDTRTTVPSGPVISTNDGEKAQNRTYQDLLRDRDDENNFEQLATSELYRVTLGGKTSKWMESAMYKELDFSPDGNYLLVQIMEKPFSYLVPYSRFPFRAVVYSRDAKPVQTIAEIPLQEELPKGLMAVRQGRREFGWRSDKPAALVYVEALDGGDPEREAEFRDAMFQLEAPFNGSGKPLMRMLNRFDKVKWGNDDFAVVTDTWWNNRNTKSYVFNPSDASVATRILFDRNYQDIYSDPGDFVTRRNAMGASVVALQGSKAYLTGKGFSEQGQFPFLDALDLEDLSKERLYQSTLTDKMELISDFDPIKGRMVVQLQSPSEFPNYYFRNLGSGELEQLTFNTNPFQSIAGIYKRLIHYQREDGIDLSATLYLPPDYDTIAKEKLPMILWAYPREYKDKSSAAQTSQNPNAFTYPSYGSMIYWVTRGYAVLDDASFPIVGVGEEEPNDTFRSQLVANAKAAIDAIEAMGYLDRSRVAVAGHSYGAFMVANLLSHSDLFSAGIARSGAYNRTLTPFGFQYEERTYWDAPDVYNAMSPFMHADKMNQPLLLIHGGADNNSGTYTMQSERYFNALKGIGATTRLVILPKESHGYRARESILHLLWEQDQWLEKYVKNKEKSVAEKPVQASE